LKKKKAKNKKDIIIENNIKNLEKIKYNLKEEEISIND